MPDPSPDGVQTRRLYRAENQLIASIKPLRFRNLGDAQRWLNRYVMGTPWYQRHANHDIVLKELPLYNRFAWCLVDRPGMAHIALSFHTGGRPDTDLIHEVTHAATWRLKPVNYHEATFARRQLEAQELFGRRGAARKLHELYHKNKVRH